MRRTGFYMAPVVGAAMLAGLAGTALGQEGPDRGDLGDRRPHHAMKHDGKGRHHGRMHDRMHGGMHGSMLGGFAARHIEGTLAFVEAELAITDEQQAAWNALEEAVRGGVERMRALREEARAEHKADAESGTTKEPRERPDLAERLDRMEAHAEARLQTLKEVNAAFKPLYASLSDDQKEKLGRLMRHLHRHRY